MPILPILIMISQVLSEYRNQHHFLDIFCKFLSCGIYFLSTRQSFRQLAMTACLRNSLETRLLNNITFAIFFDDHTNRAREKRQHQRFDNSYSVYSQIGARVNHE